MIKSRNIKAGLSIKPKTSVREIIPYLNDIDLVLIMTVEPGFGGQKFMKDCADKISEIKDLNIPDVSQATLSIAFSDDGENSMVSNKPQISLFL